MEVNVEKALRKLQQRGFQVSYWDTKEEAADYLCEKIRDTEVGIGGSKTVEQMGLFERLSEHNQVYWHWRMPGSRTLHLANAAPVYLCSANAITEGGEILNIDGRGNRLAGTLYGPKDLYIVAGINKICPDFESALYRARNVAAVLNCKRFPARTPCKEDDRCHDCRVRDRICRGLLVLWGPMMDTRTEVVLIGEELGM